MSYNFNRYSQNLRNVPGANRPLRIGEPINTKFGWGIIVDIQDAYGGSIVSDVSSPVPTLISVLFPNAKVPVNIPVSNVIFESHFGGQTPGNAPLQ